MSLIKCPECKQKISDTAITCPRCGYDMSNYQYMPISNNNHHIRSFQKGWSYNSFKQKMKRAFSFEWLESLFDKMDALPTPARLFLKFIVSSVLIIIFLGIILAFCLIALAGLEVIFEANPFLGCALILIIGNVIAWFASYRWGERKKWFFRLFLFMSIAFVLTFGNLFE